jgi:hypothetical protein
LFTRHHSASHTTSWRHHPAREEASPRLRRTSAGDTLLPGNQDGLPSSHTLDPTEPRLDLSNQKRGVTSPARHRTLRGAGTGQTAPVHHRTEINVVLSFQNLYLSPFRAPIWTPDLCFVAGPTFWVFWVVIVPR